MPSQLDLSSMPCYALDRMCHILCVTSLYQANPSECHYMAIKIILKYLRKTKDKFIIYGGAQLKVESYCDASFQTDKDVSKSHNGFVFILNGEVVSWKSSKQDTIVDSTTKVECISASEVAKRGIWIKFINELGVVTSIVDLISIY